MRGIRVVNLDTGEEKIFKQARYAAEYLKISDRNLSYQLRGKKNKNPYKRRYIVEYAIYTEKKKELKDIINYRNEYEMLEKYGRWKISKLKQFPKVLICETVLPFYNEYYFRLIKTALKSIYFADEFLLWFDNEKPEKERCWERKFCRMQIFFKFNYDGKFKQKILNRKTTLDKLDTLIDGLNELKKENEIDELYARFTED